MNSTSNQSRSGPPPRSPPKAIPPAAFAAEVEEIADVVVPRHLRPEDPGRSADTRVLRVKVAFSEPCPLKLGQRVEVSIAAHEPAGAVAASQKRAEPQAE